MFARATTFVAIVGALLALQNVATDSIVQSTHAASHSHMARPPRGFVMSPNLVRAGHGLIIAGWGLGRHAYGRIFFDHRFLGHFRSSGGGVFWVHAWIPRRSGPGTHHVIVQTWKGHVKHKLLVLSRPYHGARLSVAPVRLRGGSVVRIAGSGLLRSQPGGFAFDGHIVGHFRSDRNGKFVVRWRLPRQVSPGMHLLILRTRSNMLHRILFVSRSASDRRHPSGGRRDGSSAYLGVAISGVPGDMSLLDKFQQDAGGKHVAIINFWRTMGGSNSILYPSWLQNVASNGSVPMITWVPENRDAGSDQSPYTLANIAAGADDSVVNQWAQQLKAYGGTVLLRFAHEMNGMWFPWSQHPRDYVAAWRHIHDIFVADGATNVKWVWCPNTQWNAKSDFAPYFPGNAYVDWVALDSYNKAANGGWLWFSKLFDVGSSYHTITSLTNKPLMIAETSSAEASQFSRNRGHTKAQWITNAFTEGIPSMPRIKAVVWMNDNLTASEGCCDWSIDSSASAESAFAHAISSSYYKSSY